MKTIVFSVFIALALYSVVYGDENASKLDNVDVDAILHNDRLLTNYANCLLDKGTCTAEGQELKSRIRGALASDCAKCSPKQKENFKKVMFYVAKNKPDIWKALSDKYDPDGAFKKQYASVLKEAGIN